MKSRRISKVEEKEGKEKKEQRRNEGDTPVVVGRRFNWRHLTDRRCARF